MKRILNAYDFTAADVAIINGLGALDGGSWKRAPAVAENVRTFLRHGQNNECVYCELPLEETSRGEVDHIAALNVDDTRYPEFAFESHNLALSCSLCNGSSCKGRKNTIHNYDVVYRNCTFTIVHPYFDDPVQHFMFVQRDIVRVISDKGQETVRMFKLDLGGRTDARSAYRTRKIWRQARTRHPILAQLIERTLTFIARF